MSVFYRYSDEEYYDDMAAERARREEQEAQQAELFASLPAARCELRDLSAKARQSISSERVNGVFVAARQRVNDAINRTLRRSP